MVETANAGNVRASTRAATAVAICSLVAFVVETQMTQYVQTTLGYRQAFFVFYLVHSTFALIFPLHLIYLVGTSQYTLRSLLDGIYITLKMHLTPKSSDSDGFPTARLAYLLAFMLVGVTLPGLLWFIAVPLAPISDVTALWNANAFFAYVFSVRLLGAPVERRRLGAVLLATAGVLVVVYGGVQAEESEEDNVVGETAQPAAPLAGDLLTLVASVLYGLYQVLYKKYAAFAEGDAPSTSERYSLLQDAEGAPVRPDAAYPLPFGLFPNLLTGAVGLLTIFIIGALVPLLDVLGVEPFRPVPDARTGAAIGAIALGGMVFNAGFMVLLSVWGPVVTSVGGLTTIVLMFMSDAVFGAGLESVTVWSLAGAAVIVASFGILAHDMIRTHE